MSKSSLLAKWVCLCAAAEFLGIGAASLWYGSVSILLGEPDPLLARTGVWLLATLAAVPEGLVLGSLQARGIGWFLPGLSARKWILATISVGLVGWGIGTFIPLFLFHETAQAVPMAEPGIIAIAAFAAVFGLLTGVIFGLAQAWALPAGTKSKAYWVIANTIGWAIGLPAIYIAAQIASDMEGWALKLLFWASGGLGAGASIGLATGFALIAMGRKKGDEVAAA